MQWWTFKGDAPVSVGRSLSNHVVVRNSHVSRRHFELRPVHNTGQTLQWRIVSHGKNGTFLNGRPVSEAILPDDATVQLAPKGPVMKVYLRDSRTKLAPASAADPVEASAKSSVVSFNADDARAGRLTGSSVASPVAFPSPAQPQEEASAYSHNPPGIATQERETDMSAPIGLQSRFPASQSTEACDHAGNQVGNLLCIRCGRPLRVIRSVRHYKLLRLLAQGGMGTTFLAWRSPEPELALGKPDLLTPGQRLVVLKQLNPEMASIAKAQELFEREAKVLQQMNHPGIPTFLDSFRDQERSYLVMELVHGQNLEQYMLQAGPVPVSQVLQWMQQVCDVLHHLHTHHPPILHRDIKPANLLRQYRDGSIVVVDFGAVKCLAESMGTCITAEGYTAPEQEAGKPCVASDLFSVGATMLFLLSRKSPLEFYSGPMATGELQLDSLHEVMPKLAHLLRRLLAEKAKDRPSSALELKFALTACMDEY